MTKENTRRGNTQEGRVTKNKVILNVIQDLQRLPLSLPLINNLCGRSHIKYGMTPFFDNNGCVEDAQQPLSIRVFNEKHKKNTFISPLTWATPLLSPTGEDPFPMRGKVAEGRMRGLRSVLPQLGSHPTYKGNSARAVTPTLRAATSGMTANWMSGSHLTYKDALNKVYRLGVSPTGAASKPEDIRCKAGKLSGLATIYKGRRGFTLIELLVVVLIIGILAAVAVPQYQKAVEKSRATQALALLKSMAQAVESYYLANGEYPTSFADLDVDVPAWTGTTGWLENAFATDTISNEDWSLQIVRSNQGLFIGRISGPYAGAGWGYFPQHIRDLPLKKILCAERTDSGIRFTKQTGDYCQKVMGFSNHYDGGAVQLFD